MEDNEDWENCILVAIRLLELDFEGVGGVKDYTGSGRGYAGTGLRAPGMAFYNTRYGTRLKGLRALESKGFLADISGDKKSGYSFRLTPEGKVAAEKLIAEGYHYYEVKAQYEMDGFVSTSYSVGKNLEEFDTRKKDSEMGIMASFPAFGHFRIYICLNCKRKDDKKTEKCISCGSTQIG
jgi:DNA-binding PadR family transcriptional regulator